MKYIRFRSARSYFKSVLLGTALGLLITIVVYLIVPIPESPFINDDILDSMLATCLVDNGRSTGTGVLLNTGYIITAAHVVDKNKDDKLSLQEREVSLEFYNDSGSVASVHSGRVVYFSTDERIDFSIIEVPEKIKSKIELVDDYIKVGDKLFTIGCVKGRRPHITYGYKSTDHYSLSSRVSLDSYFGGSGGGVYIDEHEIVGVMRGVGIHRRSSQIEVYLMLNDEFHIISGRSRYFDVIPSSSEYTSSFYMFNSLKSKNLLQLIKIQDEELNLAYPKFILITLLQACGVLFCAFFFRKEILTP